MDNVGTMHPAKIGLVRGLAGPRPAIRHRVRFREAAECLGRHVDDRPISDVSGWPLCGAACGTDEVGGRRCLAVPVWALGAAAAGESLRWMLWCAGPM